MLHLGVFHIIKILFLWQKKAVPVLSGCLPSNEFNCVHGLSRQRALRSAFCFFFTLCVHLCVSADARNYLFPRTANQSEQGTQNLTPQGHRRHTRFIFLLCLGYGGLSKPSRPLFYCLPTGQNFRNLLNLLPIDFPPEFTILLKIQRNEKGRHPQHTSVDRYTYYAAVARLQNSPRIVHIRARTNMHTVAKLWRPLLIVPGFKGIWQDLGEERRGV